MTQKDTEYLVGGYRFATKQDAKLAKQEKQRVTLLDVKVDYNNMSSVARLYEKAVQNQVFVTPIGINYLSRLQQILVENDRPEGLLAIPVNALGKEENDQKDAVGEESLKEEEVKEENPKEENAKEEGETAEGNILEETQPGTVRLTILVESLEKQLEKKDRQMKRIAKRMRKSMALSVVLAALIVILFVIALTGENANILNYKRVLTDQYASWEQELRERENAVREKEQEMRISEWEEE